MATAAAKKQKNPGALRTDSERASGRRFSKMTFAVPPTVMATLEAAIHPSTSSG
jgi:hypothetical protein